MSEPRTIGLVGLYDDPDSLVRAAEKVRDKGLQKWDCHTPYPIHGLDSAMGQGESPIPWLTLTAGFIGLVTAVVLTGGLNVLQYPIVVGGKALFSWQAYVPIYFELFILFAALATMGSVVMFCRLGKWSSPLHDSGVMADITSDRFAVVIDAEDEKYDEASLRQLLEETGCRDIRPLVESEADAAFTPEGTQAEDAWRVSEGAPWYAGLLNKLLPRWSPLMFRATLLGMVATAVVVPLLMVGIPFIEFFNGMAAQPKGKTQMTYGRVFGQQNIVYREPLEGTVPRDIAPERYAYKFAHMGNTVEEARMVGAALTNPLPRTMENMERGQELYNTYCYVCHGYKGMGDGPVIGPERFPAPPSLHTDQARDYPDGTIYHILTKGIGKMPSYANKLEPQDRWQVIHYLRALQRANHPEPEDLTR